MSNIYGTLLSSVTVGAGGTTYNCDFTSIPQTYTDLVLVFSARSTTASGANYISINGRSADAQRLLIGSGSAASSTNATNQGGTYLVNGDTISTDTANTFSNVIVYIPNYTSTAVKSLSIDGVTENNGTTAYQFLAAATQTNSAAITSISIGQNAALAQYTTAYLYGLLKGSGGATAA